MSRIDTMRPIDFPTTPPPLDQRVTLTRAQADQITAILGALSRDLENLPVLVSQHSEIIGAAGAPNQIIMERLTRAADRLWRDGERHPAREVIRFDEENIEEVERANYMLYSVHLAGAMILTVGWQISISLTQMREEVADVKRRILRILKS